MTELKTEILINTNTQRVWEVLTHFEGYSEWNPFIQKASCTSKKAGEKLAISVCPPDGKSMNFEPILLRFDENKELRWKGKLLFEGLFDGEHYFILQEEGDKKTKLIHGETFSGILVKLLGGTISNIGKGFEQLNSALKERCEQQKS